MIIFNEVTIEYRTTCNSNYPYILDHLYKILIIGGSGSGITNTLLNVMIYQSDIDKMHFYAKYSCEPKYKLLRNKREKPGIYYQNNP